MDGSLKKPTKKSAEADFGDSTRVESNLAYHLKRMIHKDNSFVKSPMQNLTLENVQKYIAALKKKGLSREMIQRKLASVQQFLEWFLASSSRTDVRDLLDVKRFLTDARNDIDRVLKRVEDDKKGWLNGILRKWSFKKPKNVILVSEAHPESRKTDSGQVFRQAQDTEQSRSARMTGGGFATANLGPQHYIGIALVLVLMATLGAGAFNQFFNKVGTPFAFPASPTKPAQRYVSFQGRVTDSLGNPIVTATNFQFKLYNAKTGGTSLYATGTCSLTPDQDGILNVLVGGSGLTTDQNVCGTGITENIFSDFPNVYLGITIGADSEATPRQQIANVGYAVNAETLQGFPPGTGKSTIPYLDLNGDVLIATSGASIKSLYESANFTLASSNNLVLQSSGPAAGAGDIILQATGSGALRLRTAGATDTQTRLIVANGGNVGIGGELSPGAALSVGNSTTADLFTVNSSTGNITQTSTETTGTAHSITANSVNSGNVLSLSATGLTIGNGILVTGGTALTTASLLNFTGLQFNPGQGGRGNLINATFTDASTNAAGSSGLYGVYLAPTINISGAGSHNTVGFNMTPVDEPTCGAGAGNSCDLMGFRYNGPLVSSFTGAGTLNLVGLKVLQAALTVNGTGILNSYGAFINNPNITQTAGTVSATGVNITNGNVRTTAGGTTGGTEQGIAITTGTIASTQTTGVQKGIDIAASGVAAGTLTGINISGITGAAGTETAIAIGSGWDNAISINSGGLLLNSGAISISTAATNLTIDAGTTGTVSIGGTSTGDVLLAGGSGATGCTVTNSNGNLTCSGNITGASTGTVGYWTRATTTLSPATGNDVVSVSSNDTTNPVLTLTSTGASANAMLLTANSTTTGNALGITANGLSSGNILSLTSTSTAAASNTQKGLNIALSGTNGTSGQTTYGAYISNTHAGTTSTNVGLYATTTGGTTANYAAIFDQGYVGIGTTTPTTSLEILGDTNTAGILSIRNDANTNTSDILLTLRHMTTGTAAANIGARLVFQNENDAGAAKDSAYIDGILSTATNNSEVGDLRFLTRSSGTVSETVRITGAGNVGIGTTGPVARLDIVGSQNFTAFTAPGALTAGAPTAGGACTAGTHSYKVTFTSVGGGETTGGTTSNQITCVLTTGQTVPLSAIPTGPTGTLTRKIYRTVAGDTGSYLLVTTINDNTTTTYSDITADGSLGAAAPGSNTTAVANLQTGGTTKMVIDSTGNVGIGNTAPGTTLDVTGTGRFSSGLTLTTGALNLTSTSGTAALTLTSSTTAFNVQSGLFDIDTTNSRVGIGIAAPSSKLDVNSTQTSGTLVNIAAPSAVTQTSTITAQTIDLTNYTPSAGSNLNGSNVNYPTSISIGAADAATYIFRGYGVNTAATIPTITQAGSGTVNFYAVKVQNPNITQTAGTVNSDGLRVETADITTGGTENGLNIVAGAGTRGAGTLNGIRISNITAQAATETAISIGTGWDTSILGVGALTINSAAGNNITLDSAGAGTAAINLGTTNATSVLISNASGSTTVNGLLTQTYTGTGTASTFTANSVTTGNAFTFSATGITNGNVIQIAAPTGLTQGSLINMPTVTVAHTTGGTASLINLAFTETSTNTAGPATNGIRVLSTVNVSPATAGTFSVAGVQSDLSALTSCANNHSTCNVFAFKTSIPAIDLSTNDALVSMTGFKTSSGSNAFTVNNASATLTYASADLVSPNIVGTSGTVSATGVNITNGNVSTSGTQTGIAIQTGTITTAGTQNGVSIAPLNAGAGSLNAIKIGSVGGASTSKIALNVDMGWDTMFQQQAQTAFTQSRNLSGVVLDYNNANFTPASGNNLTGYDYKSPALTVSSGTATTSYTGYSISTAGALVTQTLGAPNINWTGETLTLPTISNGRGGTVAINGISLTVPSSVISTATGTTTANVISVPTIATGPAAGTLTGINIGNITTPGVGTENALSIGTGWDQALVLSGTPIASTTLPFIQLGGVLASGSANGTYIGANPAAFTGNFFEFQVGGVSKAKLDNAGVLTVTSCTGCGAASVLLNTIAAATGTSSIDSTSNAIVWNWNSLSTQTGMTFGSSANALTSGTLFNTSLTQANIAANIFTGSLINATQSTTLTTAATTTAPTSNVIASSRTYVINGATALNPSGSNTTLSDTYTATAGNIAMSGNILAVSRGGSAALSQTLNISGALAAFTDNALTGAGTLTHSGKVLALTQSNTNASGDVLTVANSGNGKDISGTSNTWNVTKAGLATFTTGTIIATQTHSTNNITDSGALTINSTGANALTLDSTTTGAVNIGNNANAKTITIGNNTGATALNLTSGTGSQTYTSSVVSGTTTTSAFVFNGSAITSGTTLRLTSTSTSGILFDQNATNTSGTINNLAYGAAKTQAGNIIGVNLDFNTNLAGQVGAAADFTGLQLKTLPAVTETGNFAHNYIGFNLPSPGAITNQGTSTFAFNGFNLSSPGALTQNTAAGTINWSGTNITLPASTSTFNAGNINPVGVKITAGNITASGGGNATESAVLVDQSSATITTGGTINGFLMNAAGVGAGTLNGINISNITGGAGTENAINIGTGWDNDIVFNNASPTIKFAATDNTTNLSIVDTSSNNLLAMRDLSTNFGAAVTSGAFISRNSYYGDEFMNFHQNNCSQTTTTANGHNRGDFGAPNATACTANTGGELSMSNVLGVAASGNTCLEASQNIVNGAERIGATSTTTASNTAACLEFLGQNGAGTTALTAFAANNLPVVVAKVRPSVTSGTDSNARFFIGLSDKVTANGQMPNNGIFFSNCSTFGATPTCTNTTWQGVVTSAGAIVGTVQSCTAGADTGTINTTNFNYLRIEVRSNTDIHFFVDTDTTNGIKETECGTGVSSAGPGATALSVMMESAVMSNVAVTENLDIDYFRVWQDDNAPTTGTASLPPVEAAQVPNFADQSSITQDYLMNNFTPIPGTLVSLDTQSSVPTVKLADREYDPHLAGIVASNSGVDLSNSTIKGAIKVATHGRTTVRVSDENGPIRVGDYLTSSASHPGIAMRATRPGPVIGTALSSYSGGDLNQVLIEVNRTYQDPDTQLTSSGDLKIALNQQGQKNDESQKFNLFSSTGEIVKRIGAFSELAVSYIKAGFINAQEILAENIMSTNKITSPIVETTDIKASGEAQLNQISTNVIRPQNNDLTVILRSEATPGSGDSGQARMTNNDSGPLAKIIIKGLNGKTVSTIDAAGNASFSGTLAAKEATISGTIAAGKVETKEASITGKLTAKEIESDTISDLRSRLTLAAQDSGQARMTSQELSSSVNNIQSLLAEIRKQPLSDPQYYQNLDNNPVVSSLVVSGDTTLYNATIANSLTAGTISIENNQLISLTTELKLSALSSVNILDGAVVIARDGTMTTKGTIIAKGGIEVQNSDLRFKNKEGVETAQIDSSGSAKFKSLALDKYLDATSSAIIATPEENFNKNGLFASAIETQKQTAGVGIVPVDSNEIVIYNQTVKDASLIYLTPTTQTSLQLTVSQKLSCGPQSPSNCKAYFKVTSSQPIHPEIGFNWLIID